MSNHVVTVEVIGRPATFATAHEKLWKEAVRAAVRRTGAKPRVARWAVKLEFRTPPPKTRNDVWDIDNLVKPTLDAMEGILGCRDWLGPVQVADDRVDWLQACKRTVAPGEQTGVTIEAWTIENAPAAT